VNVVTHDQGRFRGGQHVRHRHARRELQQRRAPVWKGDDGELGDHQIHRTYRRERQSAPRYDLRFAFRGVLHGDHHSARAGDEVHRAAHAGHHLAGNRPVRQPPGHVDLQSAEDGHVDMTTTNETERHGAVEGGGTRQRGHRPSAGVGQPGLAHAFLGHRARADQPVLRLEEHLHSGRHVVRDERRDPDAEVDEHPVPQLLRDPSGDDGGRVHDDAQCATR
jgi:hypothetical protein